MDFGRDQSATWEDRYFVLGEGDEDERDHEIQERAQDKDGLCESMFIKTYRTLPLKSRLARSRNTGQSGTQLLTIAVQFDTLEWSLEPEGGKQISLLGAAGGDPFQQQSADRIVASA